MKHKAIFLLHSFDELVSHLTNEEAGILLKAIFDYDIRGKVTEFDDRALLFLFTEIKRSLDRNKEHYEDVCKKRAESAKKRWMNMSAESDEKETMQMHPNGWKVNTNVKDKENINVKENVNVKDKENTKGKEYKGEGFEKPDTQIHKKPYGEFGNVYLTDEEYRLVCERLSEGQRRLQSLSAYMKATGKKYSDHYAQLINWSLYGESGSRGRGETSQKKIKPPGERREPTFDVSEFTKKAVGIKYVPPTED